MGRIFLEEPPGHSSKTYVCCHCLSKLATVDSILSKVISVHTPGTMAVECCHFAYSGLCVKGLQRADLFLRLENPKRPSVLGLSHPRLITNVPPFKTPTRIQ